MLKEYFTVNKSGSDEYFIQKSRFIGYIKRVETEEAAQDFIKEIKKKHHDATHNCSAYLIGQNDEVQKANDDGEPSGTAGIPMLEVLKKMELKDTVVVVTRYFGGIKLGAGGLIRAYGQATKEGIIHTGIVQCTLHRQVRVQVDYTWHGKLHNHMEQLGITVADTVFTDQVTVTLFVPEAEEEHIRGAIANITNGQAVIESGEQVYQEQVIQPST